MKIESRKFICGTGNINSYAYAGIYNDVFLKGNAMNY